MKRIQGYVIKVWPLFPAILYLVSFQIIVLIYLLILSLSVAGDSGTILSLGTFSELFADRQFWIALNNTAIFTFVGTPLELLVGLFAALILYRSFRGRNFIRSLFLIPLAIPALVTAMLIYILFDYPGGHVNHLLLGNYPLLPPLIHEPISWRSSQFTAMLLSLIGKVWRDMPISMLILLTGLNTIDSEILDAAKTMGATLRQRLFTIILPLIIPSISIVLLLRSVEMWKEFIFPFVLAGRFRFLGTLIDYYYNDIGNAHQSAAVALVMVACIIVTSMVLNKVVTLLKRLMLSV